MLIDINGRKILTEHIVEITDPVINETYYQVWFKVYLSDGRNIELTYDIKDYLKYHNIS